MGALFFQNGVSIGTNAGWCGYTGSNNYVVRYDFRTGAEGAQDVSLQLSGIYYGSGAGSQPFGFRLSTGAGTWANARGTSPDSDLAYMSYAGAGGYGCILSARGVNLAPDTTYYIFVYLVGGGTEYYSGWNCTEPLIALSGSYSAPGSAISSLSPIVSTQSPLSLIMSAASPGWHRAAFFYKGEQLALSAPFESALAHICPRDWMSRERSAVSMEIELEVQRYSDSSCLVPVGESQKAAFTLTADSGMCPVLGKEAVTLRVINDGEAAAFTELISGISRLGVSIDLSLADLSRCAGAEIERCLVLWGSKRAESEAAELETGVIGAERELICAVIDSRGREGRVSLEISPMAYVPPSLTEAAAARCDENGQESAAGPYYMIKAAAGYTGIGGKNSVTVSARIKPSGGQWGEETVLGGFESGKWSALWEKPALLGGELYGDSYTVGLAVRDALGSESRYELRLYHQQWAMKFNAAGTALGVGMAPTAENALQLPDLWRLYAGGIVLAGGSYGYLSPEEAVESAVEGQLYFQLME